MKKNLPVTQSTVLSKHTAKPKPTLTSSYDKFSLDIAKFDFKSIGPSPTSGSGHVYSPTAAALEKAGLTSFKAKSPRNNANPLGLSIEASEPKETYTIDKRIHPHSTKAVIGSSAVSNANKAKKNPTTNDKITLNKSKDTKQIASNYEAFLSKKKNNEVYIGHSILDRRDSKPKIMEEPPKKFSMPTNAASSLNSMHNTGSNSYRGNGASGALEQMQSNHPRPYVYVPLNPRNSQKSDTETDQLSQEQLKSSKHGQGNFQINNFLTDFVRMPVEYGQRASKGNIGNTSTNKSIGDIEVQKEDMVYNEQLRLVNDKNKKIQALNQDKEKLGLVLSSLNEKVQNYKRMENEMKERDRIIENLQTSLNEAGHRKELNREYLADFEAKLHSSQTCHEIKRAKNSPSLSDMDGIMTNTKHGDEVPGTIEQKNNLLEMITKNKLFNSKKQETSYPLLGQEAQHEKGPQMFEHTLLRKMHDAASHETLKNVPKKTDKISSNNKTTKSGLLSKKLFPDTQGLKLVSPSSFGIKEKDSLLGTPRKIEASTTKAKKPARLNTTGGAEADLPKRKFSHEPRAITEGLAELFGKKQSAVEAGSTLAYTAEKEPAAEHLDMGKALGELKNRMANMLSKHRDDHKKLVTIYQLYTQKLEKLTKE